jgi:hypothetical protein
MNNFGSRILLSVIAALLLTSAGAAQNVEKNKYQQIEVMRFEVKEGVKFPSDYLATMTEELVTQLQEVKQFKQVLREGEAAAEAQAPALRLVGTVTAFQAGNRALRYMIGFGAGKTKIVAHVKFVDRETGAVLFEKDVDGKVILGGAIKSESIGATRGLAKEVAKVARQKFF